MRKKALLEVYTIPASIILIVVLALVLLLLAKLLSATITVNARGGMADTALYAMLNSNDCTPNTKLAFKDVLGIGIAQNPDEGWSDVVIDLDYGGKTESVNVKNCLSELGDRLLSQSPRRFYLEYPGCPFPKCFEDEAYINEEIGSAPLNIESTEYIALPNGEVAKAVLKTAS